MSILIISDVHGQLFWKDIVKERQAGDSLVFLGDYFDRRGEGPWAGDQKANFFEICAYARQNPDTWLLLGNHDWHYLPWDPIGGSGRDDRKLPEYRKALENNLDILLIAKEFRLPDRSPIVCSHGGVTNTFMALAHAKGPEDLNRVMHENPELFTWREFGPQGQLSRWDGDDPWQSPLWTRHGSLAEDSLQGYDQIVGHTPIRELFSFDGAGGKIHMTCTLNSEFMTA